MERETESGPDLESANGARQDSREDLIYYLGVGTIPETDKHGDGQSNPVAPDRGPQGSERVLLDGAALWAVAALTPSGWRLVTCGVFAPRSARDGARKIFIFSDAAPKPPALNKNFLPRLPDPINPRAASHSAWYLLTFGTGCLSPSSSESFGISWLLSLAPAPPISLHSLGGTTLAASVTFVWLQSAHTTSNHHVTCITQNRSRPAPKFPLSLFSALGQPSTHPGITSTRLSSTTGARPSSSGLRSRLSPSCRHFIQPVLFFSSIQNDNGSFSNATIDPSMAFLQSPNTSDPSQFQRMFNGATRNMSPGFHNPNPVIPSKRARPDDGFSMSPRQAPGALPGSRSQTPHQTPFPGYPDPVNGTPQFAQQPAPTPYQHFQPDITHTLRSRKSREHPANQHLGQTQPYVQPSGPQYSPTAPISSSGAHPAMQAQYAQNNPAMMQNYSAQQIASQQRMYQMQIQNQALQFQSPNAPAAGRPMVGGVNAINNPQAAAMRHLHQSMAKPSNPESFLRGLQRFMMARGQQLDLNPIVSGRPIHLMQLYAAVMRLGGSKKLTAMNGWPTLAQQLQFPAMQYPTAAQEIRDVYLRNLAAYEQVWLSSQQKHVDPAQMGIQRPGDPSTIPQPMAPNKTMPQSFDLPPQLQAVTQPSLPQPNNVHSMPVNGFSMASQGKPIPKQQRPLGHQHRSSLSRPPEAASPNGQMAQFPPDVSVSGEKQSSPISARKPGVDFVSYRQPLEDPFKPTILPESAFHGPIVIDEAFQIGEEVMRLKPTVPTFGELGAHSHTIFPGKRKKPLSLFTFFYLSLCSQPPPSMGPDGIMSAPTDPSIHRYLPAAVDTLAKLLARDDPNRMYLKSIFSQENPLSPPERSPDEEFCDVYCPNTRAN
ncbi:hypothetical protein CIRG_07595 [Coccidioides immitis RMSCC 2394]|uniref:ARID domain-containing protein n=1 Tax=Coccidioides immitis RMSCC 2394 TaxID=404692 RepID=A0A0J6YL98_COCIT|nr:hypothetical protein CIRG_07595 [Coccidioides immitis RMSCC 2394]